MNLNYSLRAEGEKLYLRLECGGIVTNLYIGNCTRALHFVLVDALKNGGLASLKEKAQKDLLKQIDYRFAGISKQIQEASSQIKDLEAERDALVELVTVLAPFEGEALSA